MDARGISHAHRAAADRTANASVPQKKPFALLQYAALPDRSPPDHPAPAFPYSCTWAWPRRASRSVGPRGSPRTRRYIRVRTSTAQRGKSRGGAAFLVYDFLSTLSPGAQGGLLPRAALCTAQVFLQLLIFAHRD